MTGSQGGLPHAWPLTGDYVVTESQGGLPHAWTLTGEICRERESGGTTSCMDIDRGNML